MSFGAHEPEPFFEVSAVRGFSDCFHVLKYSLAISIVDDEWIKPDRLMATRTFGKQARVIPRLGGKFRAGRIVRREIRDACNIRNRVEDRPRRYKTPAATFAEGGRSSSHSRLLNL